MPRMKTRILFICWVLVMSMSAVSARANAKLEEYRQAFETHQADIARNFREGRLALPMKYVEALGKLEYQLLQQGDTAGQVAVQKERQRFVLDPHPSGMPQLQSPEGLVALCNKYRQQFGALAQTKHRQTKKLYSQYRAVLQQLEGHLRQEGDTTGAREVANTLADVHMPEPAPPPPAPPAPAPPAPQPDRTATSDVSGMESGASETPDPGQSSETTSFDELLQDFF